MPAWIVMPILFLILWVVIGLIVVSKRLWNTSLPFTVDDFRWLITKVLLSCWLISTLLFGVFYVSIINDTASFLVPFLTLVVIPVLALLGLAVSFMASYRKRRKMDLKEQRAIDETLRLCKSWVANFSFIDPVMYDIQVYISHGQATGRLKISGVTEQQAAILRSMEGELPPGIFLFILKTV